MEGEDGQCAQQDAFSDAFVERFAVPTLAQCPVADGVFAPEDAPSGGADGGMHTAAGLHGEVDVSFGAFGVVWDIGWISAAGSEPRGCAQGVELCGAEAGVEDLAGLSVLCGDAAVVVEASEEGLDLERLTDAALAVLDLFFGAADAVVLAPLGRDSVRIWSDLLAVWASHGVGCLSRAMLAI